MVNSSVFALEADLLYCFVIKFLADSEKFGFLAYPGTDVGDGKNSSRRKRKKKHGGEHGEGHESGQGHVRGS